MPRSGLLIAFQIATLNLRFHYPVGAAGAIERNSFNPERQTAVFSRFSAKQQWHLFIS